MTAKESERHLSVIITGSLAYLALPVVFGLGLYICLTLNVFPSEADSIGIPFVGFMLLWSVGLLSGIFAVLLLIISNLAEEQRNK